MACLYKPLKGLKDVSTASPALKDGAMERPSEDTI